MYLPVVDHTALVIHFGRFHSLPSCCQDEGAVLVPAGFWHWILSCNKERLSSCRTGNVQYDRDLQQAVFSSEAHTPVHVRHAVFKSEPQKRTDMIKCTRCYGLYFINNLLITSIRSHMKPPPKKIALTCVSHCITVGLHGNHPNHLLDEADVLRLSRQSGDLDPCALIGCNQRESNPSSRERAFLLPDTLAEAPWKTCAGFVEKKNCGGSNFSHPKSNLATDHLYLTDSVQISSLFVMQHCILVFSPLCVSC